MTYLRQGRNQRYFVLVLLGYIFMLLTGVLISAQVAFVIMQPFPFPSVSLSSVLCGPKARHDHAVCFATQYHQSA